MLGPLIHVPAILQPINTHSFRPFIREIQKGTKRKRWCRFLVRDKEGEREKDGGATTDLGTTSSKRFKEA